MYSTAFVSVSSLSDPLRREMASLYLGTYDGSSEALFFDDLAKKDEVLLVQDDGRLVGFTTVRLYEHEWRQKQVRVVYSGDTVVDRAHWGQQALAFDWITRLGMLRRQRPELPLYWLLLVKGHRTFRYLPLFSKSFHPHWNKQRDDLKSLTDSLAQSMFPNDYNPATGVVELKTSRGHLKPDIAIPSPRDMEREEVRFFVERNPGFQRGHELVCLCEVESDNMKPLTLKLFSKGLNGG